MNLIAYVIHYLASSSARIVHLADLKQVILQKFKHKVAEASCHWSDS